MLEFLLHKRSFRSAKLLVANSSFVADKLMQMFPNKKIMLLEKCVDMVVAHARSRIADRRSLVVKLDPINIIFAKNDWRVGGLEGILKTLGSFKKKEFLFYNCWNK